MKDVLVEGIDEFKNYLVLSERQNGLSQLVIMDRKTGNKEFLKFDEPDYTVYPSGNPEYNTDNFRFGYTSMITPSTQYEQNLKTGARKILKQQEVLGGYNKNEYTTERVFIEGLSEEIFSTKSIFLYQNLLSLQKIFSP